MKTHSAIFAIIIAVTTLILAACSDDNQTDPAFKPEAADVRVLYDTVNNKVNLSCASDVNTGADATYTYDSNTLVVDVTPNPSTTFPMTVVYTLSNYDCSPYLINGVLTAVFAGQHIWTNTGSLYGSGEGFSTMDIITWRTNDPNQMYGTLVVNGYPYNYATTNYQ